MEVKWIEEDSKVWRGQDKSARRLFTMPTIGQEFGKQPIKSNVSYGELIVWLSLSIDGNLRTCWES